MSVFAQQFRPVLLWIDTTSVPMWSVLFAGVVIAGAFWFYTYPRRNRW